MTFFPPWDDRGRLSYMRAKAIGKLYGARIKCLIFRFVVMHGRLQT